MEQATSMFKRAKIIRGTNINDYIISKVQDIRPTSLAQVLELQLNDGFIFFKGNDARKRQEILEQVYRQYCLSVIQCNEKMFVNGYMPSVSCVTPLLYIMWLHLIFGFTRQTCNDMIGVLYHWKPKINTIVLKGASNTGKSVLAKALCLNKIVGIIDKCDDKNVHFLEDTLLKEVVLWEEGSMSLLTKDICKLVLGGEWFPVNSKYKPIILNMHRTPVILTCNALPWNYFVDKEAYNNRCIFPTWPNSFVWPLKNKFKYEYLHEYIHFSTTCHCTEYVRDELRKLDRPEHQRIVQQVLKLTSIWLPNQVVDTEWLPTSRL